LRGREARVLALLSAAYDKAIMPAVLGNIARSIKAWREGDGCLAHIHLAHAGLSQLHDLRADAYRLFLAEKAMKFGASPRAVFAALHLTPRYIDAVEKLYNPDEPRVPAGSGRTSGQWTRLFSVLGELSEAAAKSLGRFALRLLALEAAGAAAVGGVLFLPSQKKTRIEGKVPGFPGLRYVWSSEDGELRLIYERTDGKLTTFVTHREDDVFRDQRGRTIGVVLPNGILAIEPSAIFRELANDNEPRLCPDPTPDQPGNEKGKDYEDYIKSMINPRNPTPRYWSYRLPDPNNPGKFINYDDCEQTTGSMIEVKDKYADLLAFPAGAKSATDRFLKQSKEQIDAADAAGNRSVRWYFAEPSTAEFAKKLFTDSSKGRERIKINKDYPWPEKAQ